MVSFAVIRLGLNELVPEPDKRVVLILELDNEEVTRMIFNAPVYEGVGVLVSKLIRSLNRTERDLITKKHGAILIPLVEYSYANTSIITVTFS